MSLFSNLNIGTRGLMASQLGMDITGQNISNAEVEGYSRKRLNQSADYRYDSVFGQTGFGVEVTNIQRVRNIHIDTQIQKQNQQLGKYEEMDNVLNSIESIMNEPNDTGIMSFIDKFFNSWENLSNNPADLSARTMVKTNGEILTDMFHHVNSELRDLQETRNNEIESRVNAINKKTVELFNLNKEIAAVEITNQNANDSRDKRDVILKDLAKLIDISVVENNMGQITVTTSGNIIVSPVDTEQLEITTATFTRPDGTSYNELGVRFSTSKKEFIPKSGQLKGLIDSRDDIIPRYIDGIDKLAIGISEKVNAQHESGYNLLGYSGISFFDPNLTGAADIAVSASVLTDVNNIAAAGSNVSKTAPTNTAPAGALNFGTIYQLTNNGVPSTGPADSANVRNIVQGTVIASVGATTLIEGTDYNVNYQSGDIQMLHAGYNGNVVTIDFDYATGGFPGPGDNANSIALAKLRTSLVMEPSALGIDTTTFDQYYSSYIGTLGLEKNEASSNLETREFLIREYEANQDAIAGVSLDEEMANLIKYQHTYQAAARIISTANQMLDVLMNI